MLADEPQFVLDCGGKSLTGNAENGACPLDPMKDQLIKTQLYWANASVAIEKALTPDDHCDLRTRAALRGRSMCYD